jgi:hypothetical protein
MDSKILDVKSEEELAKHRSNFYEQFLLGRPKISIPIKFIPNCIPRTNIFLVDIHKFSSFEGSYYFSGRDPLVQTALQLIKTPELKLRDSYLYSFYQTFQPQTYGDLYHLNKENKLHQIEATNFFIPWQHNKPTNQFRCGLFGPKDISNVKHRILRLKNLIYNIQKYGYIPNKKDMIEGYILLKENDYRFVITAGHHRVAVLTALYQNGLTNFKELLVKFDMSRICIKIVRYEDSKNWLSVKSGYLREKDGVEVFNKYFFSYNI